MKVMGKNEMNEYVKEKIRLRSMGLGEIEVLRRMYRDRDIGCKNWELYKVKVGRRWWSKNSRRK